MTTKSKEYWQVNTEKLSEELRNAARHSSTEEDLKMKAEPLLRVAFEKIGVDVNNVSYEKTTSSYRGRSDAVYGYVTIEYKAPGKLSSSSEVKKVVEQLEKYLEAQAAHIGQNKEDFLEKAVGMALDGEHVLFVRFTRKRVFLQTPVALESEQMFFSETSAVQGFHVQGPYLVNKSSISNLLIYMRASARRPLTAKDLADVFSPKYAITQRAVLEFYTELMKAQRRQVPSRVKMFYDEWEKIFGIVYGEELEKAEKLAEKTALLYGMPGGIGLKKLLFSIHTFYAFLMKLIAIELIAMQRQSSIESFVKDASSLNDRELKEQMTYLESGHDFQSLGIENFLEADFFSWYLDCWTPQMANIVRDIVRLIAGFEPATPILEPEWTKDLLQNLYEEIVPQELRHSLGEYYTPDWLAGYVIDKSGYDGDPDKRFIDPACGSGTFIIKAINKVVQNAAHGKKPNWKTIGEKVLKNIAGFDLNPLAVLTARTNYLVAFSRFIPHVRPIVIPVYLCDSVLAPSRYEDDGMLNLGDTVVFRTTRGDYTFPDSVRNKNDIDRFTTKIDVALKGKIRPELFRKQLEKEFDFSAADLDLLGTIYGQIKKLDDNGEDGIWAKYMKNAFAPTYLGKFDYVIGNPPWVRWGTLSSEYRRATLKLWHRYGLFSLKGFETRLGGGEKDFSMLFTYACADNYLMDKGKLGFVITMEVFKSKGAGEGFRHFELKNSNSHLKMLSVDDMVDLKPFSAANKTSVFFMQKGKETVYPVPAVIWKRKKGTGKISPILSMDEVNSLSERIKAEARPIDNNIYYSSWQITEHRNHKCFDNIKGINPYKGFLGARVEPYGVFWLKVKEVRPDRILVIENLHDIGKWTIQSVRTQIESDLIYPAVSGGDITKFGVLKTFYLLISQNPKTKCGYDENILSSKYPLTLGYLTKFKETLEKRAAYKKYYCKNGKTAAPFYSQFNIGDYTFAKYRVVWKRMSSRMAAVVLSSTSTEFGQKQIIATDTTSLIPVDNKEEAHYLCAILNSSIINDFILSFSAAGRGFGAPSVIKNIAIPRYNSKDKLHTCLSNLSESAHERFNGEKDISNLEKEINKAVKKLWNIK